MRRPVLTVLTLTACVSVDGVARAVESIETLGTVESVTVYRGQALVTRQVELPGPAGLYEAVIGDLPERVVPGSIYAEPVKGVEVRSVRYRVRPLEEDLREEVRKLDQQLQELQDQSQSIARRRQVLIEHKAYLGHPEQFVAPTATMELTRGVLNAETLQNLTLFILDQRSKLSDDEGKLAIEDRILRARTDVAQRERQALTGSSPKAAREAVVFVNVTEPGKVRLRLRYIVNGATWTPSYNVRTDAQRRQVILEYYASIQQTSGEDWNNVSMALSTATPSLVAKAPVLVPLAVGLAPLAMGDTKQSREELVRKQKQVETTRNFMPQQAQIGQVAQEPAGGKGARGRGQEDLDRELNTLACEGQLLDIVSAKVVARSPAERPALAEDEGLSVTYELVTRTTLPSRTDQQLVQIASLPLEGEFYRVAMPVLTSYVYEEAGLTNTSPLALLAGPVSTYVDGRFVGHAEIPTVTIGERFAVGLGVDSSLRATRELVDRTESVQGGNRVAEFKYRLSIENFAAAPIFVRIMDRLPVGKESEVKFTLLSSSIEETKEPLYQQVQRKKGILRWEIEVAPQATGMNAQTLDYTFQVEYDKGMMIAGLPSAGD